LAFEVTAATGRYIVASNPGLWFVDIAKILQKGFPTNNFPCWELPNFVTLIGGMFDKRISLYHLWVTLGIDF
jgi:hypothetical protein